MKKPPILDTDVLSFSDYFRIDADIREVLGYFGFQCAFQWYELPRDERGREDVGRLREWIHKTLPLAPLNNESTRRQILISPILIAAVQVTGGLLLVEHAVDAGPQLHGNLDYMLQTSESLLVVEAKNADLVHGMTQLAAELVAVDRDARTDPSRPVLYGAVKTGSSWQFAILLAIRDP